MPSLEPVRKLWLNQWAAAKASGTMKNLVDEKVMAARARAAITRAIWEPFLGEVPNEDIERWAWEGAVHDREQAERALAATERQSDVRGRKRNDVSRWADHYMVVCEELGPDANELDRVDAMNLRGHAGGKSQHHAMKAKARKAGLIE